MTNEEMVSIRDYVDVRIAALEQRFASLDRSTDLAAAVAERTRAAVEGRLESIDLHIQKLETSNAGAAASWRIIGVVIVIATTLLSGISSGLVVHFIR